MLIKTSYRITVQHVMAIWHEELSQAGCFQTILNPACDVIVRASYDVGVSPRLFHSIEKLDIRSRPHSLLGDRQLNPSYRMALECGLSFFIRTT